MNERIELKEITSKDDQLIPKTGSNYNDKDIKEIVLKETLHNEYIGMLLCTLSMFFQAFGAFYTKVIQRAYPKKFHTVPFLFLRSFMIVILASLHTWFCGLRILYPSEIPLKKWFFYRTNMNFFGMSFFTMSLWYLRASTAQILSSMSPILVLILSYFILKEPYYRRYAIGIIMCVFGSLLIILNERNPKKVETKKNTNFSDTLKGLGFGICSLINVSFVTISNKILASNNVPINTQLFYVGITTMSYSTIFTIIFGGVELEGGYLIMCMIHGIFFYSANFTYNQALKRAPVSKLIIISYLQIVYVFILAYLFLHENIFFTDILGAAIMLSYMIYNAYYPIKKK